jgi:hypothetical protein
VITVINLRVPLNAGKFFSGCTIGIFSRRAELRKQVRHQKWFKNLYAVQWQAMVMWVVKLQDLLQTELFRPDSAK